MTAHASVISHPSVTAVPSSASPAERRLGTIGGHENPIGGFLMKDLILLGAALWSAGEALGAARRR